MRAIKTILLALTMILPAALSAQEKAGVEIDYNNPRKYIVSGVSVEGNTYFSSSQIIQLTGLMKGMEITVPGDDISSIIDRLWAQKYFEDISIKIDHLSENADSAWFVVGIKERARVI